MKMELIGYFIRKIIEGNSLEAWLARGWPKLLSYSPTFHIVVKGLIFFEFGIEKDIGLCNDSMKHLWSFNPYSKAMDYMV